MIQIVRHLCTLLLLVCVAAPALGQAPSADDYASLSEALATNPGEPVYLPAGDYPIDETLRLLSGGLYGPGRIIQRKPAVPALTIHNAEHVRIEGITLARPADTELAKAPLVDVRGSSDITLSGIRVENNKSRDGAIYMQDTTNSRIQNCTVQGYKCIAVDDRTDSELYGYAFRAIDGTGIMINACRSIQILDNRIADTVLLPTEAVKAEHNLGMLTDGLKPEKRGRLAPKGDYVNNWHQGSAIVVTAPTKTAFITVRGNQITNAAQGIDIHADYVTCTENQIDKCLIGLKVLHGSKHVVLSANTVSGVDLWGIVMQPGTSSWSADSERPANVTAGNIVANNVFTDFGHGHEWYNWKGDSTAAMLFDSGPLEDNPPMTQVIIEGNLVYNSERETLEADAEPRYAWALRIAGDAAAQQIVVRDNLLQPGYRGVSNVDSITETP